MTIRNHIVILALAPLMLMNACASSRLSLTKDESAVIHGTDALPIVKADPSKPDPTSVLRQKARPVDAKDPALSTLVERMQITLEKSGGVGLAAPQVGVSRRVVLVKLGTRPAGQPTRVEVLVNPVVEWSSPEMQEDYEGCLSVDGVGGMLKRHVAIRIRYEKVGGGEHVLSLTDWDARIAQHELDHLDGVLYVDLVEGSLLPVEEARQRRNELHRSRGWIPAEPAPPTSSTERPAIGHCFG